VILNEKLVEAAAKAAQDASPYADWDQIARVDQIPIRDKARAAIAVYLGNRTLPDRMREAAEVLHAADQRCHGRIEGWTPADLIGTADAWEAEDNATVELEALVDDVAQASFSACSEGNLDDSGAREIHRAIARTILARFDVKRREVSE